MKELNYKQAIQIIEKNLLPLVGERSLKKWCIDRDLPYPEVHQIVIGKNRMPYVNLVQSILEHLGYNISSTEKTYIFYLS